MLNLDVQTTFNGKPMSELEKAITLMNRYMGYTADKVVIAMAINVLKSIRTRTVKAKIPPSHKEKQTTEYAPGYAYINGKCQRVLRSGGGKGHHITFKWKSSKAVRALDSKAWLNTKAYFATFPQRKDLKEYILAATDAKDAKETVLKNHPITTYQGLAKRALGIAMAKIGANGGADSVPRKAEITASKVVTVNKQNYGLTVIDNLGYAQNALKGGQGAISDAQNAAINKVLGWFKHKYKDLWNAACNGQMTPQEQLNSLIKELSA